MFNYTDHLGNVRLSYADADKNGTIASNEILEESSYYPFGMKHSGYNSNNAQPSYKYKYNGKELQDELGLNMDDYGWRNYMPDIGRWTQIDPLFNDLKFANDINNVDEDDQEEVYMAIINDLELGGAIYNTDNLNPYGYGYNNPISFDDPDGRCPVCVFVVAALLYSEFANAPTGNAKLDSKNYNDSQSNSGETSGKGTPKENVAKRDANHHKNKDAIRGREQQNIKNNGGAKSEGGTSGNAINGVSPKNPNAAKYDAAAKKEFGN